MRQHWTGDDAQKSQRSVSTPIRAVRGGLYLVGGFYSLARVVKVLLALVALFLAGGANWQVNK